MQELHDHRKWLSSPFALDLHQRTEEEHMTWSWSKIRTPSGSIYEDISNVAVQEWYLT